MNITDARELTQHLRNDGLSALAEAVEERLLLRRPRTENGKIHAMADAMDEIMSGPDCEARQQLFRRISATGIGPRTKPVDLSVN